MQFTEKNYVRLCGFFTLWALIFQTLFTPLVSAKVIPLVSEQVSNQTVTASEMLEPTPTPVPIEYETGFVTDQLYPEGYIKEYPNFNEECPPIVQTIKKDLKFVPEGSLIADTLVNVYTDYKMNAMESANLSCSQPQSGFIEACKHPEGGFYSANPHVPNVKKGLETRQFYEDFLSSRKETFLLGYNHGYPPLVDKNQCFSGVTDRLALSVYTSYLLRLKRYVLNTLEGIAMQDLLVESSVLNGVVCAAPAVKVGKTYRAYSKKAQSAGAAFEVESKWCDKLKACQIPQSDIDAKLDLMVDETVEYYKNLHFIERNLILHRLAFGLVALEIKDAEMIINRMKFKETACGDDMINHDSFYPFNEWAPQLAEMHAKGIPKKTNENARTFDHMMSNFGAENLSEKGFGKDYRHDKREGTFLRSRDIKITLSETFYSNALLTPTDCTTYMNKPDSKPPTAAQSLFDIILFNETKKEFLQENAKINLSWTTREAFKDIDIESNQIFEKPPNEEDIRKRLKEQLFIDREKMKEGLLEGRRAARCSTSKYYTEEECNSESVNSIQNVVERVPYFNPFSAINNNIQGTDCFKGAYGYARTYFDSANCSQQVIKHHKKYQELSTNLNIGIGASVVLAGFTLLSAAGKYIQFFVNAKRGEGVIKSAFSFKHSKDVVQMGGKFDKTTTVAAGLAAIGVDGYLMPVGVSHVQEECKEPLEAYAVSLENIDLADFESGPSCDLHFDKAGNNLTDLKRAASNCTNAVMMSALMDFGLPIIGSIGIIGQGLRATKLLIQRSKQAKNVNVDVRNAIERTRDAPESAPAPPPGPVAELPHDAPVTGRQTSATQPDAEVATAAGKPDEARLNDQTTASHTDGPKTGRTRFGGGGLSEAPLPAPAHRQGMVGKITSEIDGKKIEHARARASMDDAEAALKEARASGDIAAIRKAEKDFALADFDELAAFETLRELRAKRGQAMDALTPAQNRAARLDLADDLTDFRSRAESPEEISRIETGIMNAHEVPLPPRPSPDLPDNHPDMIAYRQAQIKALKEKNNFLIEAGLTNPADRRQLMENWVTGIQERRVGTFDLPDNATIWQPPPGMNVQPTGPTQNSVPGFFDQAPVELDIGNFRINPSGRPQVDTILFSPTPPNTTLNIDQAAMLIKHKGKVILIQGKNGTQLRVKLENVDGMTGELKLTIFDSRTNTYTTRIYPITNFTHIKPLHKPRAPRLAGDPPPPADFSVPALPGTQKPRAPASAPNTPPRTPGSTSLGKNMTQLEFQTLTQPVKKIPPTQIAEARAAQQSLVQKQKFIDGLQEKLKKAEAAGNQNKANELRKSIKAQQDHMQDLINKSGADGYAEILDAVNTATKKVDDMIAEGKQLQSNSTTTQAQWDSWKQRITQARQQVTQGDALIASIKDAKLRIDKFYENKTKLYSRRPKDNTTPEYKSWFEKWQTNERSIDKAMEDLRNLIGNN
jgi:hypothetical protein